MSEQTFKTFHPENTITQTQAALAEIQRRFKTTPTTETLTGPLQTIKNAATALDELKVRVANDPRLTEEGRTERLRDTAKKTVIPKVKLAADNGAFVAGRIRDLRNKLKPEIKLDPQLGAELRAFMRDQPKGQAQHLLLTDMRFWAAAVEAPAALSGLDEKLLASLESQVLEVHFPEQAAEILQSEESLQAFDAALRVVMADLQRSVKFDSTTAFEDFLASADDTFATVH